MKVIPISQFAHELETIVDEVLATGEPVIIERNGKRLHFAPERAPTRLDRLPRRSVLVGDPEELVALALWRDEVWQGENSNDLPLSGHA